MTGNGRLRAALRGFLRRCAKASSLIQIPSYRAALFKGIGAAIEHEAVLNSLRVSTVIDVGANNGQFSLVARNSFPNAIIYAFEPLAEASQKFELVFSNDRQTFLRKCALGQEAKSAVINVSHRADSSSLLPISQLQSKLYPGTHKENEETIMIGRGDAEFSDVALASPVLLKLDVQGYEMEVLLGFGNLIDKIDYVYAEISFIELYVGQQLAHQVIQWLAQRGLHLGGIYNVSLAADGTAIQADALFIRSR
jgi:FkbM family methyltransferase